MASHQRSSVFHQRGWLEAMARTYGYEPLVITSARDSEPLSDGIVLCRVSSWITGTRWVSLPFSDHCDPLIEDRQSWPDFAEKLRSECDQQRLRYVELRPRQEFGISELGFKPSRSYCLHELDLHGDLKQIFSGFHKQCIQRKIRRAEREHLTYENGNSKQVTDEFYRLVLLTRKRHGLLPQPRLWFQNLIECMGKNVQISIARKDGRPVAGLLCLRHRTTVVYKYGASDNKFHPLGGMPFLFWRLIEESKAAGAVTLDLGRSDLDQVGLVTFKDRLGADRKSLLYYRYPETSLQAGVLPKSGGRIRTLAGLLPGALSSFCGRMLYRHIG